MTFTMMMILTVTIRTELTSVTIPGRNCCSSPTTGAVRVAKKVVRNSEMRMREMTFTMHRTVMKLVRTIRTC